MRAAPESTGPGGWGGLATMGGGAAPGLWHPRVRGAGPVTMATGVPGPCCRGNARVSRCVAPWGGGLALAVAVVTGGLGGLHHTLLWDGNRPCYRSDTERRGLCVTQGWWPGPVPPH